MATCVFTLASELLSAAVKKKELHQLTAEEKYELSTLHKAKGLELFAAKEWKGARRAFANVDAVRLPTLSHFVAHAAVQRWRSSLAKAGAARCPKLAHFAGPRLRSSLAKIGARHWP